MLRKSKKLRHLKNKSVPLYLNFLEMIKNKKPI